MIKQDNRPEMNDFNENFDKLRNLLNEDDGTQRRSNDTVTSKDKNKLIIISVNGNNNTITTEKSNCHIGNTGIKRSVIAGTFLCLLFF